MPLSHRESVAQVVDTEILPDEKGEECAAFLTRAIEWFGQRGLPIERIMTGNGSSYRSHLFRRAFS